MEMRNRFLPALSISCAGLCIALGLACDGGGGGGSSTQAVDEVNNAPSVAITSPSDGADFYDDELVELLATAEDSEDGSLTGSSLSWNSDVDGSLGVGTVLNVELSANAHDITVTATDSLGAKSSDSVTITVQARPPADPFGLIAVQGAGLLVDLSWVDNSENEVGFKVERREGSGSFALLATLVAGVTESTDTTVQYGKTYTYRICAYNSGGDSGYATAGSVAIPLASELPSAPSNLVAIAVSASRIDLTWADNSNNESGFRIERKTGVAGTYSQITEANADIESYSNTGLSAETTYYYRICAFNSEGSSSYSSEAHDTTLLVQSDLVSRGAFGCGGGESVSVNYVHEGRIGIPATGIGVGSTFENEAGLIPFLE